MKHNLSESFAGVDADLLLILLFAAFWGTSEVDAPSGMAATKPGGLVLAARPRKHLLPPPTLEIRDWDRDLAR
eukprot:scaffold32992_cov15-Prasinocladus_malaysianus.AAC.1